MKEILERIKEAQMDGKLSSYEIFQIMAEVFSQAEDYCRGFIGEKEEFEKVKQDVRSFLLTMFQEDNPSIPNWIEPFMESQLVSLVDPVLDSMWEKINESA